MCVCVSPAKTKLKAFTTCIHIQLTPPPSEKQLQRLHTVCSRELLFDKVAPHLPPARSPPPTPNPGAPPPETQTQERALDTMWGTAKIARAKNPIQMFTREAVYPPAPPPLPNTPLPNTKPHQGGIIRRNYRRDSAARTKKAARKESE